MRSLQPLILFSVLFVACDGNTDPKAPPTGPDGARALIIQAQSVATTGDTPRAADLLAQALVLDPSHVGAWHRLGEMRLLSGLDGVFEALDRAQSLGLDTARFRQTRGEAHEADSRDGEARAEFLAAIEREPLRKEAWFRLAQVERRLGSEFAAGEALAEFKRIERAEQALLTAIQSVQAQPTDALLAAASAGAHLEMGFVADAQEWLDKAFSLRQNLPEAHLIAGRIARREGDMDTALVHFELVSSLAQFDPRPWMERSSMALAAGDLTAARNHSQQAAAVAPADARVFLMQARMYIQLGEFDAALDSCERALLRDSEGSEGLRLHAHTIDLIRIREAHAEKDD